MKSHGDIWYYERPVKLRNIEGLENISVDLFVTWVSASALWSVTTGIDFLFNDIQYYFSTITISII